MTEENDTSFGTTVRAFKFNGDETLFCIWESRTLALAEAKGFLSALTKVPDEPGLTADQYEDGEVSEVGPTGSDGIPPQSVRVRPCTTKEIRRYQARTAANTYLFSSCDGKAYALIEKHAGDPARAWSVLKDKYRSTDAEENYPMLSEKLSTSKLVEIERDPDLWFNDLDHLNSRLSLIKLHYQLDELQLKSHIMNSMSKGYEPVVVKFRGELADISLDKLQKEVVLQYKWLLKNSKPESETVMNANVNKRPWRKFKGTCNKCGAVGHKASKCPTNRGNTTPSTGGTRDISTVTCHKCKQKGHYANNCPSKTQYNSPLSAMFVGVCSINSPSDAHDPGLDSFFDDWCPDFGNTDKYSNQDKDEFADLPDGFLSDDENKIEDEAIYTSTYENETVMSGSVSRGDEEWLLDSGATCGVTYERNGMTNI